MLGVGRQVLHVILQSVNLGWYGDCSCFTVLCEPPRLRFFDCPTRARKRSLVQSQWLPLAQLGLGKIHNGKLGWLVLEGFLKKFQRAGAHFGLIATDFLNAVGLVRGRHKFLGDAFDRELLYSGLLVGLSGQSGGSPCFSEGLAVGRKAVKFIKHPIPCIELLAANE